jgi:simple sugar transport system permease protein
MSLQVDQARSVGRVRVAERSARPSAARRVTRAPEFGAVVAAVLLYVFFAIASAGNGFTSVAGTASWLNTAAQLGIIAVPLALLMIAGDFDLSIGSMVGAGSIAVGVIAGHSHESLLVALAAALGIAVVVGLGNGLLVTRTGVPSFIVTLAANLIVAGLALAISRSVANSTSVQVESSGFVSDLLAKKWGDFDITILWWLVTIASAAWVLGKTQFGNWILATGGDAERARRAGVRTSRVKISLFVCTAIASGFVGALQAVQFNTGDATTGQGYVFQAPIVVIIGGVLLTGGYGTILGVVLGTIIYGIVSAGLFYTGWNTDYAQVVIGVLMVVAVLANSAVRKAAMGAFRSTATQT